MRQVVEKRLWGEMKEKMNEHTSEMKQLKEDQDKSKKELENAFQRAIVSAETLYGCVHRSGSVLMPLCYVVNPQETLLKAHREVFTDKIKPPHPIRGPKGRCHFSFRCLSIESIYYLCSRAKLSVSSPTNSGTKA